MMSLPILKKVGDIEIQPTRMTLPLVDRSLKYPYGVGENMLVKVDKLYFQVDFVIIDMEEHTEVDYSLSRS